jgi:hypothetical protein
VKGLETEKHTSEEIRTIKARVRRAAKTRGGEPPDPDEFVELMASAVLRCGE